MALVDHTAEAESVQFYKTTANSIDSIRLANKSHMYLTRPDAIPWNRAMNKYVKIVFIIKIYPTSGSLSG